MDQPGSTYRKKQKMTSKTKTTKAPKISAAQQRIVDAIAKNGASTDAELATDLGGSPSNINRSLAALVKAGVVVQADGRYGLPVTEIDEGTGTNPSAPAGDILVTADLEKAEVEGTSRQSAGKDLDLTPSGSGAKMVTISNSCYVTTDGKFVVAKGTLEAEEKKPWALYTISPEGKMAHVGSFKTCTAAFGPEGVLR